MSLIETLLQGNGLPDYYDVIIEEADVMEFDHAATSLITGYPIREPVKVKANIAEADIHRAPVEILKINLQMEPDAIAYVKHEIQWKKVIYEPTKQHDHPVSHIFLTQNEEKIIRSYGQEYWIDLFSNDSRNARYKVNSIAYSGYYSGKDYIRALHRKGTNREYRSCQDVVNRHPSVKHVYIGMALWYLDIEDIATLCFDGKVVDALVHRHDKVRGMVNREQSYVVDANGFVTQTSPLGEQYRHKTVEPYFKQQEARTSKGIIAWTLTKMAGDSYAIKFVACPGFQPSYPIYPLELPNVDEKKEAQIIKRGYHYDINTLFGYTWLTCKAHSEIVLTDIELFEDLCRYISGRPRDDQSLKDLTHYARRLTDKKDLFAKHSDKYHNIPHKMMVWYIQAAFYEDIQEEVNAMVTFRRQHKQSRAVHTKLRADLDHKAETISTKLTNSVNAVKNTVDGMAYAVSSASDITGMTPVFEFIEDGFYKHPLVDMIGTAIMSAEELKIYRQLEEQVG